MITMQPVPMYRPPSCSCQRGVGNLSRSTLSPLSTFSVIGPLDTSMGLIGFWLPSFSFHARMMSSPVSFGSKPKAKAVVAGEQTGLVTTRKPFGITFDVVEQNDLWIRRPRRHFGDRADFQIPIGAVDDAQLAELVRRFEITAQIFVG